jgi:hypothetical protein
MPNAVPGANVHTFTWGKSAYRAPVAKKLAIGAEFSYTAGTPPYPNGDLHLPAAIEVGMTFSVKVSFTDRVMHRDPYTIRTDIQAVAGDTFNSVLNKVIDSLNSKMDKITVTSTTEITSGDIIGLLFTADIDVDFTVLGMGILETADIIGYRTKNGKYCGGCNTDALDRGQNTYAQCKELEIMCLAEVGKLDTETSGQEIWSETSYIENGVDYTKYVLTWADPRRAVPSMKTSYTQNLYILVPAAATALIAELDAIFAMI